MLIPAYIIEDLLRREKERNDRVQDELYIEMPALEEQPTPNPAEPSDRGIVIIDYSL